jgi:hypothetical protein
MALQLRDIRPLRQRPDTDGPDFIYRDEQLAAAFIQGNQVVETSRLASDESLDCRVNQAGSLTRINNSTPNGQYHWNLLPGQMRSFNNGNNGAINEVVARSR